MNNGLEDYSSVPDLASDAIQVLINRAKAMGLTWSLRMATVANDTPLTAIYDGDTVPLSMTSMIGAIPKLQRVYVMAVPPAGNFIVGNSGLTPSLRLAEDLNTVAGGVLTTIPWGVVNQNVGNWPLPSGGSITIPSTGWYSITATLIYDAGGAVNSFQYIMITPTSDISGVGGIPYRANWGIGSTTACLSMTIPLNAGDNLVASAFQNSAPSLFYTASFNAIKAAHFVDS